MSRIFGDVVADVIEGSPLTIAEWHGSGALVSLVLRGSAMQGRAALLAGSLTYTPAELAGCVSFGADGCTLLRIGIGAEGLSGSACWHAGA